MSFQVGSLVTVRGREWVVLPGSDQEVLRVRPVGGSPDEETGILLSLESADVKSAHFEEPIADQLGDFRSCRLLRDAVRITSRASSGPFRCLSRIAVEPRPYQMVPLLLALKQDPVRLLIADDVGIGKTVEACLILKELIDRGEVQSFAVLSPPHLAEQWQKELSEKFHIDAELLLAGTVNRLERDLPQNVSIFDHYKYLVISMDFIKSERRRNEFINRAPQFIIVDEAHTCAYGGARRSGRHFRHEMVRALVDKNTSGGDKRNLVLVTATPHSGKDDAFRSLLSLLKEEFQELPEDLGGKENESLRRRLAEHFVQRRRANLKSYDNVKTPFPDREESEETYLLSDDYSSFLDKILDLATEKVQSNEDDARLRRINWWSALALLRSLSSSPAAAAATLRNRAKAAIAGTLEEVDEAGRESVLDTGAEAEEDITDITPGADITDAEGPGDPSLLKLAQQADKLKGEKDEKLQKLVKLVKGLVEAGHKPIVFCRFIPTAAYVAEELSKRLGKDVHVGYVTGEISPSEREGKVFELGDHLKRVLVCTDCLSEGINLQMLFDAVLHYDLSWNPTRHEQREGRVDRFGQKEKVVKIVTYYGKDNPVDGIVLEVLLRKFEEIRRKTGVGVPVPKESEAVLDAILEGLLLRKKTHSSRAQDLLPGLEDFCKPQEKDFHAAWEASGEKEGRLRTMFAQEAIKVEELQVEIEAARKSVGTAPDLSRFVMDTLQIHGGVAKEKKTFWELDFHETPYELRDRVSDGFGDSISQVQIKYDLPVEEGVQWVSRTHPLIENLASFVLESALDGAETTKARRCGVIRTKAIEKRTTILLARFRFDLTTVFRDKGEETQISEETGIMAFSGAPDEAKWLESSISENLLDAEPSGNLSSEQAKQFIQRVLDGIKQLQPFLKQEAARRADELKAAHSRVRTISARKGIPNRIQGYKVNPNLPVDILGIYVLIPQVG